MTKALKGTPVDDWIRLFNAESEEELDMITTKNEGITEAINVLKSMSLRRPLKALFDDYMKAKRDRWDEAVLKQWLLDAASAMNIESFREKMGIM